MKPRIVGVETGSKTRFIVKTARDKGYLIDTQQRTQTEEMNLQTLVKGGYWEDYTGDLKPEDLYQ